jgi:hypothetical protein
VREVREEPKMSLEEVHPESYDYEQTLVSSVVLSL